MSDFYQNVNRVFHDWNYGHPQVLYGLIRSMKPQVVVESGCYRGFGSAWMAKALQENNTGKLICIDNFSLADYLSRYPQHKTAQEHFWSNLKVLGVDAWVEVIESDYDKVQWPEKIDFAFIDGWHSYKAARHDFDKCDAAGAHCVCFDDTTQSVGPRLLMQEIRASGEWDVIDWDFDCGLGICVRKKPLRPITYSQEVENLLPGMDLTQATKGEQMDHFAEARRLNGISYDSIIPLLHPAKEVAK